MTTDASFHQIDCKLSFWNLTLPMASVKLVSVPRCIPPISLADFALDASGTSPQCTQEGHQPVGKTGGSSEGLRKIPVERIHATVSSQLGEVDGSKGLAGVLYAGSVVERLLADDVARLRDTNEQSTESQPRDAPAHSKTTLLAGREMAVSSLPNSVRAFTRSGKDNSGVRGEFLKVD
ncbi:hypothetical protein BSKO_09774 [Bryopsis sp. KO-2023]|nr:hypothetical protein BSKO_09774 [Bryopsis sp. KO-2023]